MFPIAVSCACNRAEPVTADSGSVKLLVSEKLLLPEVKQSCQSRGQKAKQTKRAAVCVLKIAKHSNSISLNLIELCS